MKKKHLMTIAAITGICVSSAVAATETMFSLASRRHSYIFEKERKKREHELLSGYPRAVETIYESSEALKDLDLERVETESFDRLKLVGHYYPAENAQRTIILFHGWRSSWNLDFGSITPFLHSNGCNLLFVEQRGHGESEGKYISFGLIERFDVLTWIDFVRTHLDADLPLYLYGISMGASTILMAADRLDKTAVKGIISDCAFTSPTAIIRSVLASRKGFPAKPAMFVTDRVSKFHAGFKYEDYSTTEAMKRCQVPILFIHGLNDTFVPVEMTYSNFETCASPKDMLIIKNCDHGMGYSVNPNSYEKKLISFWKDNDQKR